MLRPARRPTALCRSALLTLALSPAAGCLIDTEDCGIDFVLVAGRCVPAVDPPPLRAGDQDLGGPPPPDAARPVSDAASADRAPPPDLRPPEPDPSGFTHLLIVDRTRLDQARNTPQSPGVDVDAVEVAGQGPEIQFARSVVGAQINDPFGVSRWTDPAALLGRSDGDGLDLEGGSYVSLGAEGAYVYLEMSFRGAFTSGDFIYVLAASPDGPEDVFETYLCPGPPLDIAACRSLGLASQIGGFLVP